MTFKETDTNTNQPFPDELHPKHYASEMIDAALKVVADKAKAAGFPVTGDFDLFEVLGMEETMQRYAFSMLHNNETLNAILEGGQG